MAKASQTPVMRQYLAAKAAHPDALLLFRMGDFYELFFEDAVVAARALDLTLTARNKGSEDEIPMAGVPHHAASAYVQRLLEQGFKVAICEQMADPSKVKGLVPREVVRVVSPGHRVRRRGHRGARRTTTWSAVERAREALRHRGARPLDGRAARLRGARTRRRALAELVRLDPREVLVGPGARGLARALAHDAPRARPLRSLDAARSTSRRRRASSTPSSGSGEARRRARRPSRDARRRGASPQRGPPRRGAAAHRAARRSTSWATRWRSTSRRRRTSSSCGPSTGRATARSSRQIDATRTPPGARLLRRRLLAPLTSVAEIRRRHDGVELFVGHPGVRAELRDGSRRRRRHRAPRRQARPRPRRAARPRCALRRSLQALPGLVETPSTRCPEPEAREALGVARGEPVDRRLRRPARAPRARASPTTRPRAPARAASSATASTRRSTRPASSCASGQRVIVELEARLREASGIPSLKLRVHARLRLVHRGHAHAPGQGPARVAAQADGRERRALHVRRARRRSPTSSPTPRSARVRARPSSSRRLVREPGRARRAASRRRGPPRGVGRGGGARRGRAPRRLGAPGGRRLARAGPRGRAPPGRREARRGRPLRAERRSLGAGRRQARACGSSPGPNMAGKSTLMRQTALCRDPRADGQLRAGATGAPRASSTACSRAWARATTCRAARARSWSR